MSEKIKKTPELANLHKAILALKTEEEVTAFFRDLMTVAEIREFCNRWEAARLLAELTPYREVAKKTGMSTATVTRIAHWLYHGEGGYRMVLKRLYKLTPKN